MGISGSLTGLLLSIIACLVYGVQAEEGIDYAVLRQEILSQMNGEPVNNGFRPDRVLMPGTVVPTSTYAAAFVHLAFQCMSTFDHFKQAGGCDGGRIRYAPEISWPENAGLDMLFYQLLPVFIKFPNATRSDIIIYGAQTALEHLGAPAKHFCAGRKDSSAAASSQYNALHDLKAGPSWSASGQELRDFLNRTGLTLTDWVLLAARPRSRVLLSAAGYLGTWSLGSAGSLSNVYYRALLGEKWAPYSDDSTKLVYKAAGKSDVFITPLDYDLLQHEDSAEIVRQLASADNAYFLDQFARTWSKFVNLDRAGVSCT